MIEAAPKRRAKALALIDWPLADRESWRIALLDGDVLEPGGPASKWALATRSGAGTGYGRWLAWLASRGPLERDKSAVCHVTPANVAMFVAELRQEYATSSAATYLAFLVMALGAMAPNQDWGWLQRSVARLRRRAQPVRDKRRRLQSTDDLLSFGIELMTATDAATSVESAEPTLRWEAATQYRDGLMIALLALRPLRRKNFCAIEIGRHLLQRKQAYWLAFERTETKNNQPLENPFPNRAGRLARTISDVLPPLALPADRQPRSSLRLQTGGREIVGLQDWLRPQHRELLLQRVPANEGQVRHRLAPASVPRLRRHNHRHQRPGPCSDHPQHFGAQHDGNVRALL